jgi:hypothetical protein
MPTRLNGSALAAGLLATTKIIGTARTTESAELQAEKAEHQETNDVYRCGNLPKNRMQLFVKAKGN